MAPFFCLVFPICILFGATPNFQLTLAHRPVKLEKVIDTIFLHVETNEHFLNGREASVEDFKAYLKRYFETVPMLAIYLVNPYDNIDKTLGAVKELIKEMRNGLSKKGIDADLFTDFKGDQFECPSGNIRMDELKRYLKVYDLKESGKKEREIMKIIYPSHESMEWDLVRMIKRDRKNAETIIANVENGFFPGKY